MEHWDWVIRVRYDSLDKLWTAEVLDEGECILHEVNRSSLNLALGEAAAAVMEVHEDMEEST